MEQFREYSPEDIILSNLDESAIRQSRLHEQELAHLSELAREIIESQSDTDTLLAALPDFRFTEASAVADSSAVLLQTVTQSRVTQRNLLLCQELCHRLGRDRVMKILRRYVEAELPKGIGDGRIAYQKSAFSDSAFLRFSSLLNAPRATYTHSFLSACEDVCNGNCQYCILPIENSTEGRLVSFTKLIDRFALKIIATCEIAENEGKHTQFALLSATHESLMTNEADHFLEFSIPIDLDTPSRILQSAELCGLTLSGIASVPAANPSDPLLLHAVYSVSQRALAQLPIFLLYLCMEAPQFVLLGVYPHLKS